MKQQIDLTALLACAASADLMRKTEPEPELPEPRDPTIGFQPDELVIALERVAEWGARGWNRVLDWQERESKLGPCINKALAEAGQ